MDYAELRALIANPGGFFPEKLLSLVQGCTASCRDCPRWETAAKVVTGSGPTSARLMVVTGAPTAAEDQTGEPIAGAAADIIAYCLEKTGIGRPDLYITCAVKHFSANEPAPEDYAACRRWLEAEMAVVKPEVVLCLGNQAAEAVLGHAVELPAERGRIFHPGFVPRVVVTVDPATILAESTEELQRLARDQFLLEFHEVAEALGVFDPERGREELAQL